VVGLWAQHLEALFERMDRLREEIERGAPERTLLASLEDVRGQAERAARERALADARVARRVTEVQREVVARMHQVRGPPPLRPPHETQAERHGVL
jgi:hypothetical protein